MKLTPTTKRTAGMTLLELTVVILVLLSLISILFVGARAWKKGSDRAANILNIRNVQQAVRGHQNMNQLDSGATLASTSLFGTDGYLKEPKSPKGADYTYTGTVPATGILYISNPAVDGADYWYTAAEVTAKTSDW
jgi:type II secretory pathway pseudopilin PulG